MVDEVSWTFIASCSLVAFVIYHIGLVIYRLYFSPLARIPGPKLAAATSWYEGYYDVVKDGLFFKKIQELHKQYGPIVRINPSEVHIADSDFFDVFNNWKVDKVASFYEMTNLSQSIIGTPDHNLHRKRRAALNPFFSRGNIDAQVPLVHEKAQLLRSQLEKAAKKGSPERIDIWYTALTLDVVTQCSFGETYGTLEDPHFAHETSETFELAEKSNHLNRFFPPLRKLMSALPPPILISLIPRLKGVVDLKTNIGTKVQEILKNKEKFNDVKTEKKAKPTVYHQILSSNLPPEELTERRLTEDGAVVVFAGLSTTARALTVTTFYLARQPEIIAKMRAEWKSVLDAAAPGLPTYTELEVLPYLTAVVREGIRMSWGASTRLPRSYRLPFEYGGYTIPPGTAVSMNTNDVLMDPKIFHEPLQFKPERWLTTDGEKSKALDKYFVAFGRGARSCVGLWLAYSEMYIGLAAVYSKFDFELFQTDERHVEPARDFFTPHPNPGFEGVQVIVKSVSE